MDDIIASLNRQEIPLESTIIRENFRKLINDCNLKSCDFLDELYSKNLLESYEHANYTSVDMPYRRGIAEALKSVIYSIKEKSSLWKNFLQALKDCDLQLVADYLQRDYEARTTATSEDSPETRRNLDQVLTPDDLSEVYEVVFDARPKWFNLGVALKLRADTLNAIEAGKGSVDANCLNMIQDWLQNGTHPTWRILAEALGSKIVGRCNLKKEIMT